MATKITPQELDLLHTYRAGPRIWDAASLQPVVASLASQRLILPHPERGDRGAYYLTDAGMKVLDMDTIWYDCGLSVRRPGSPGVPDHRVQVDCRVTVRVRRVPGAGNKQRMAARTAAAERFRELGLGTVMDMEGARVSIDAMPL